MRNGFFVVAVTLLLLTLPPYGPASAFDAAPAPYTLQAEENGVSLGLFYPPETLAALAAEPAATLSKRITEAIRMRTPIVVMWRITAHSDAVTPVSPYKLAILDRPDGNPVYSQKIEPLWTDQQANDLASLDRRVRPDAVGAIAAFPPESFVPGRWIYIYSGPQRLRDGAYRTVQRSGTVLPQLEKK